MHKAIGSAVYLYTRQMYLAIETRASWDSFISCSPRAINELQFWHNNVSQLNGRDLFDKSQVFDSVVYLEASQLGLLWRLRYFRQAKFSMQGTVVS